MTIKAYIYAHGGELLGYLAYNDAPPEILELNGRHFKKKRSSREMDERDTEVLTFDYCEIDVESEIMEIIQICVGCGRNASLVWWKCCPEHVSLDGPDVYCQSCVERLHPEEDEFERE